MSYTLPSSCIPVDDTDPSDIPPASTAVPLQPAVPSASVPLFEPSTCEPDNAVGFDDGLDFMFGFSAIQILLLGTLFVVVSFSGNRASTQEEFSSADFMDFELAVRDVTWRLHKWLFLPGILSIVLALVSIVAWFTTSRTLLLQSRHLYFAVLGVSLFVMILAGVQRTAVSSKNLENLHSRWLSMMRTHPNEVCALQHYFLCSGFQQNCLNATTTGPQFVSGSTSVLSTHQLLRADASISECPLNCSLEGGFGENNALLGYTFTPPGAKAANPYETSCGTRLSGTTGISRIVTISFCMIIMIEVLFSLFLHRKVILAVPPPVSSTENP